MMIRTRVDVGYIAVKRISHSKAAHNYYIFSMFKKNSQSPICSDAHSVYRHRKGHVVRCSHSFTTRFCVSSSMVSSKNSYKVNG